MDKLDFGIVFDAFDDFDEIFNQVLLVRMDNEIDNEAAIKDLNSRLKELNKIIPLQMFVATEVYGQMEEVAFKNLKVTDIFNANGELAGPPFYYLHINATDATSRIVNELEGFYGSVFE